MTINPPKELHILDDPDAMAGLLSAYEYMKTNDGQKASDKDIENELKEAVVVMEAAKKEAEEQARSLGVTLATNPDGTVFTQTWNKYHQSIELTATIAGNPTPGSFSYEGREIKISIQLSASNTNFSPDDINTLFEDIYKAAQDLNNDPAYLASIKQIYEQFKILGVLCPDEDSIEKLKQDYAQQLTNNTINLTEIRKRCTNLVRLFNDQLALEQLRIDRNDLIYMPAQAKELKPYIKAIRQKAIENTSAKRRPIIINAYRQRQNKSTPSIANYTMRIYKPNSDTPSTQRDLAGGTFSNDWSGTLKTIAINNRHVTVDIKTIEEDRRSSSIAKLHGRIEDIEDDKEQVYKAFKKLVIQYARNELITQLNAGETIPKELIIKEAYITLLSPFITEATAHKLPVGEMAILKSENEEKQLAYTRYCLEQIAKEELKFEDIDRKFIIEHTKTAAHQPNDDSLQAVKIKHRSYFCNYMVNSVAGLFRTEKLDWTNINYKYFVDGNLKRREHILEYFKENIPKVDINNFYLDLFDKLDALIGKSSRNPCSIEQLHAIQKLIDGDISQLGLQLDVDIKIAENLKQILILYLTIEGYFLGSKKLSPSRIAAGYLASALDAQLATLLGFTPHHTCKSGIDRTGLQATLKEALLTAPADLLKPENANELLERAYISLQHGSSREIKTLNNPGARGLQIPDKVLWYFTNANGEAKEQIFQFLQDQKFDSLGKMAKAIYNVESSDLGNLQDNDARVLNGVLFEKHKDLMLSNFPSNNPDHYHATYDPDSMSIKYRIQTETIVTETKAKDAVYDALIEHDANVYQGYLICLNNANITAQEICGGTFTVSGITSDNVADFMQAFNDVFNDDTVKHVKISFTKQSQLAINQYLAKNPDATFKSRCKEVEASTRRSSSSSTVSQVPDPLLFEKKISDFEEYVETHCKHVSYKDALEYATKGEEFLLDISNNNIPAIPNVESNMSCVIWCLLKKSYDNGHPFGKGMFNIAYEDSNIVQGLYSQLIENERTYDRLSTHYNARAKKHHGLDVGSKDDVPLPWKFKTICFGLCEEPNREQTLYLKPEKHGVNIRKDPLGSFLHGADLIRSKIKQEKIHGTNSYRETGKHSSEPKLDIQMGNELRFTIKDGNIELASHESRPNSREPSYEPTHRRSL